MTDEVFGPITTSWEIEEVVVAHLKSWSPTYLAFMGRRAGKTLPPVRSFVTTPRDPEKWAEDQLPAILVVSPGLAATPTIDGAGVLRAIWEVGLASITSAAEEADTRKMAHYYFMHALVAILQNPSMGIDADTLLSQGWDHTTVPGQQRRTLASTYAVLHVGVDGVLDSRAGPLRPLVDPDTPPADFPDVASVEVTAEKES